MLIFFVRVKKLLLVIDKYPVVNKFVITCVSVYVWMLGMSVISIVCCGWSKGLDIFYFISPLSSEYKDAFVYEWIVKEMVKEGFGSEMRRKKEEENVERLRKIVCVCERERERLLLTI